MDDITGWLRIAIIVQLANNRAKRVQVFSLVCARKEVEPIVVEFLGKNPALRKQDVHAQWAAMPEQIRIPPLSGNFKAV